MSLCYFRLKKLFLNEREDICSPFKKSKKNDTYAILIRSRPAIIHMERN